MKYLLILLILLAIPFIQGQQECNEIYFFIVENNWDFNETELNHLNITNPLYYITNYTYECYLKGYSPKLPKIPDNLKITINKTLNQCNIQIDPFFEVSIPFIKIPVGELNCNSKKVLSYFFKIEDNSIKGINLWVIFTIIMGFLIYKLKKESIKYRK